MISTLDNLISEVNKLGYEKIVKDTQNRIILYMPASERKTALRSISNKLKGRYVATGPGWKSSAGGAVIGKFTVLAKPEADARTTGSLSQLDARVFTKYGSQATFEANGRLIDCVVFNTANKIEKSIIQGAKESNLLGDSVAETFENFFESGNFTWDPDISFRKRGTIGVYAGEILIGWVLLSRRGNDFFSKIPFNGTPSKFYLPTDPKFSGVDSFVEMQDGSYHSISSKFGRGAQASFFSNMLETAMKNHQKLGKSVLREICDIANSNGFTFGKSKQIVYTYGIRKILKFTKSEIPDPMDIYNLAAQQELNNPKLLKVMAKILEMDSSVKDLPLSMSNFFNKFIANELNNDEKSIKQIKEILQGKNFWQVNLREDDWRNGKLKFSWLSTSSGQPELKFIGYKSSSTDITCKQGWINYELKYTKG